MNIIILGAGRVGESVAESLVSERNDITVIDTDPARLRLLQDRLDLRGVTGNGIQPSVLETAGARDADMLIACAPADETNLVACKVAHERFGIQTRIARIRSPEFMAGTDLLGTGGFAVNEVICPEESVTRYIRKLIEYPEALQVLEFADGAASLIAVRAVSGGPMVRHIISELPQLVPGVAMRFVAIYRQTEDHADERVVCDGRTRIEPGDEVFVLAATRDIRRVLDALRRRDEPVRRVMIAGGGRVGLRLAREIADDCRIKLVESAAARCEYLTTQVADTVLVLHGDSTDEDLLEREQIDETDLFVSLTSDDEDNIMGCLLAKRMGAKRVLALINRRAYADLVQGTQIDIALSPAQTVIGELLAHVRRGDIEAVYSLRRGAAEALEAVARGDRKTSKVVGRRIDEIRLPKGAEIGALVRGEPGADNEREVIIPHHDTVIEQNDHVIVFLPRKRMVREIEKLFQVSATFMF
ncbi:TrkA-N domain protein [Leptothrix cholodnii SP-6]|uniref:Trk system potassium uptake protein TrkA n=1 Tax=Leptothrix cholodnii (strain ATCC 51168 / LMG 8142 / SP-6) TaxID=395495 RepID=B1XWX3_LEPCP|nr:Trk system potassium transporter TrkA [Leptothrix cholodnii]ACB36322.1 TrkA-N domain protein [Leptothrix cholodnii SP-6]